MKNDKTFLFTFDNQKESIRASNLEVAIRKFKFEFPGIDIKDCDVDIPKGSLHGWL